MFGSRWIVFFAAISGLVCGGIGAMGSHSLPKRLQESGLAIARDWHDFPKSIRPRLCGDTTLLGIAEPMGIHRERFEYNSKRSFYYPKPFA